jgi:O-antigen ligase
MAAAGSPPPIIEQAAPALGDADEAAWAMPWRGVSWSITYVAFLVYIAVIITYRVPLAFAAMVTAMVGLAFQREKLTVPPPLICMGVFIGWAAVGYTVTSYPDEVWERLTIFLKLWLVALAAVNALRSSARIRFYLLFFLVCYAAYPLRGSILNYYVYHNTLMGRTIWNFVWNNPNDLASISVLVLSMLGAALIGERKWWLRAGLLAGATLIPFVILLTQSRGAFLAIAATLLLVLAQQKRRGQLIIRLALVIVLLNFVAPAGVTDRIRGLTKATDVGQLKEVDKEGSAEQRYEIWKIATKIIREHSLLGVGIGAYPWVHQIYALGDEFDPTGRGWRDTHSTFLNVTAETGIPGLLAFLTMLAVTLRYARRTRKRVRELAPRRAAQLFWLEHGLIAYLLAGIWGTYVQLPFLYLHLMLLWSVAALADRTAQEASYAGATPAAPARGWRMAPQVGRQLTAMGGV